MKLDTSKAVFYGVTEEKLIEFIEYRKEIKKPIKTQRGIDQSLTQAASAANKFGISPDYAFDITMNEEWIGVKVGSIEGSLRRTGALVSPNNSHSSSIEFERNDRSWAQ